VQEVERAREAHQRQAWLDAYELFAAADARAALAPRDLERLATSAYLIGREAEALAAFERAHHAFVLASEPAHAARCAFWLGLTLLLRGESGRATAWLGRARRLVEERSDECVESGYLLIPTAELQLEAGDWNAAASTAIDAVAIGQRFGDPDLVACARHLQGRALLRQGVIPDGLALLDEAMLAASSGELSPILTGLIYCSVIDACLEVYAFSRAREWTAALSSWCARQPQLVSFTGTCLVHRAQVMQLSGGWQDAIEEVRGACDRFARGIGQQPPGRALYEQGEVHRLRGELEAAEEAFRGASQLGCEPQPGLALLRLAQGRMDAAVAALRRVLGATPDKLQRTRLLPAYVEVLVAAGLTSEACTACEELEAMAAAFPGEALQAISAQTRAIVQLMEGDGSAAVVSARHAYELWRKIEAPYLAARSRELIGRACRALGDSDGYVLELEAARLTFRELHAAPDAERVDALLAQPASKSALDEARGSGLTARELQVLRSVAAGKSNRAIAGELGLSEKTIERHVSNMFLKLGVSTRAAATAYAYEHDLI
jgi:DNA-binding CsgD family transcriptional regulator